MFSSKSRITRSAMIGERGDPIGVPKVCLYIFELKVK